nr:MAG TPA: hypothetical protein [Caudoviricetes sp.]
MLEGLKYIILLIFLLAVGCATIDLITEEGCLIPLLILIILFLL